MRIVGTIIGDDADRVIEVDGVRCRLRESLRVANHSPDGFCWGYAGSGPAQAALAILMTQMPTEDALRLHQRFKFDHVARWPIDSPVDVEVDLNAWIQSQRAVQ